MEFDFAQQPGKNIKKRTSVDPDLALVTIITPYYNAGKYFEQTFNSVMNQTFPWFEWIIVNDGSTEKNDIEILHKFANKDARIRVITQENGGLSCARNTGFANAKTEIVIPLDADDVIAPQYVEYLYFGMYYHPEAAWCYTCSTGFGAQEYLWKYPWDMEKLKTYNFLNYTAAIRKKDAQEIGGYKVEKWSYYEDWRFWLEMLAAKKKPVHLGGYLFWYRRLDNGMLSNIRKDPERVSFCENIIKNAAEQIDETVDAVEYPLNKTKYPYHKPEVLDFGEQYKVNKVHDKIRILMLIPWMTMGGADKFNLDLVEGIDKDKFEISIISTVPSENDWQQKFEKYTDEIFNLPDFLDPAYYAEFVSYYINTRDIDVLLVTNSYRGYYMIPWLKKFFPKLYVIDYVHMEEWYWKAGGYARPSGMFGEWIDKTYVCNSATRDVMIHDFKRSPEHVETLYIGVDSEKFHRKHVENGKLYKLLGASQKRPIVLFPCRIVPQKRPFMLLNIAHKVKEKIPEVLFVVAGDGGQIEELKHAICLDKLEDTIVCIGRCNEMRECYQDAKLTLICSIKEGLSLTAYESCAMGVPVISSDVGGQRDLIDETVGRLIPMEQKEDVDYDRRSFDEKEVQQFADAIVYFLSNPEFYEVSSKNCRKKVEDAFSTKKMVENFEKEIETLLSDERLKEKHLQQELCIKSAGGLAEEIYTMELAQEEREGECENVWRERCHFERLWHNEQEKKERSIEEKERSIEEKERCIEEKDRVIADYARELERIESMRTWKMILKYQHFTQNTWVGKIMRGIVKKIYHLFRN